MGKTKETAEKKETVKKSTSRVSKKHSATNHIATKKLAAQAASMSAVTKLTPATDTSAPNFVVHGTNSKALFTLAIYRGEGMCLLAMNWKQATPPDNFVGFAIEFQEPGGAQFFAIKNRIAFADSRGNLNPNTTSSRLSPFQIFRWIHFPRNAGIPGIFTYRVTPVFMNDDDILSYGDFQEAGIELVAETYPDELNICFTRGFISSQAFVENFGTNGGVGTIIPENTDASIDFVPTDPNAETALAWMGFEVRSSILGALDQAIGDSTAQVRVAAYELNDSEIISRLEQLKDRLKIIIDNSGDQKPEDSDESHAAARLVISAGEQNVQRQHMGGLQHNKILVVDGNEVKLAIGGSTNLSWRGLYVQNNNAVVLKGANAVHIFNDAFENLWNNAHKPSGFASTSSADWNDLGFNNVDAKVAFSPHSLTNAKLQNLADDISSTESSLFYSIAFLGTTPGVIKEAVTEMTSKDDIFVTGLADGAVHGLDLQLPNGNPPVVFPSALLKKNLPPPFNKEAQGGKGVRMHHKFVVIDFDKPTARVYTGSHNFSKAADTKNGENLFLIRDQRVATSYMIEAMGMFDHYQFRDKEAKSKAVSQPFELQKPPTSGSGDKPWWDKFWTNAQRMRDRQLFGT